MFSSALLHLVYHMVPGSCALRKNLKMPDRHNISDIVLLEGFFTALLTQPLTSSHCLQLNFWESRTHMLLWVDDILLHNETPEETKEAIEIFFKLCQKYNLEQHPGKRLLYWMKSKWCSRLVYSNEIEFYLIPYTLVVWLRWPCQEMEHAYSNYGCPSVGMHCDYKTCYKYQTSAKLHGKIYRVAGEKRIGRWPKLMGKTLTGKKIWFKPSKMSKGYWLIKKTSVVIRKIVFVNALTAIKLMRGASLCRLQLQTWIYLYHDKTEAVVFTFS